MVIVELARFSWGRLWSHFQTYHATQPALPSSESSACKKRQKECFWKRNSNACILCSKLKVDCIPANDSSEEDNNDVLPREYVPKALEYWNYQIDQLETELQRTELNLIHCQEQQQQQQQQQQNKEWELSIENGQLRLLTAIRSYEELIMFSQASLRYLSPFQESLYQERDINPILSSEELLQDDKDILQMLSNKAISKVLRSCDLLFTALLPMIASYEIDIPPNHFRIIARIDGYVYISNIRIYVPCYTRTGNHLKLP
ncbi:hypothetical protein BJV82DRAFT_690141 [Fennellomyces sp. T-0311]|nr:hypothetical protein BJV82DRAFT_690141 [Fennellomyces sp. T-0311]